MERIIEKPHLPKGKVRCLIIGEKYRKLLEKPFFDRKIDIICAKNNNFVDERLSGHVDLSMVHGGGNVMYAAEHLKDSENIHKITDRGFAINYLPNPLNAAYPNDAAMNVCIIGDNVICNPKTANEKLLSGRHVISCKQGYTKCSTVVVDERSIITSDKLIAANSALHGIEAFLVNDSFVKLQGFDKGFIGGAAFKISEDVLAFTGVIKNDEARKSIEAFLSERGIAAEYLTDDEIFDIGSAIPIIEEI